MDAVLRGVSMTLKFAECKKHPGLVGSAMWGYWLAGILLKGDEYKLQSGDLQGPGRAGIGSLRDRFINEFRRALSSYNFE